MSAFKFWTSTAGEIEIELTQTQAESVSVSGDNVASAIVLMRNARVKKQLDKYTPELIRSVIDDYTDWCDSDWKKEIESGELTLAEIDRLRLLWVAGNDIADECDAENG